MHLIIIIIFEFLDSAGNYTLFLSCLSIEYNVIMVYVIFVNRQFLL